MSDFERPEDRTTREERMAMYQAFCRKTYVPVFSQPWWMDAICGSNWDVWLYNRDGLTTIAAMPYYFEMRGEYRYITKALLTQTNGIYFTLHPESRRPAIAAMQEKVINEACTFIDSMHLDVYEQQYHFSFNNWQPFHWHHYTNVLRYTYVIEKTGNSDEVLNGFSPSNRNAIRKGQRLTSVNDDIDPDTFYDEHKKIYDKQNLPVPFSKDLWFGLYAACIKNNAGKMLYTKDADGNIHSLTFLVWDSQAMYILLGGYVPEYSSSQSYPALTYASILLAGAMGLKFDFEGSMIQRVAHSLREYGGVPMPYYRIRKVFNPAIVRREAEEYIRMLESEQL